MFTTSRGGEEANGARVCVSVRARWIIDACVRMMPFFCVSYLPSCVCNFENLKLLKSVKSLSKNFLELLLVQLCLEYYAFAQPADTRRTADAQTASALSFFRRRGSRRIRRHLFLIRIDFAWYDAKRA